MSIELAILQIHNFFDIIAIIVIKGIDILILLKLSIEKEPRVPSKKLAAELFLSEPDVAQSLKRCRTSGLIYISDAEKRLNRSGLLEFLLHGFRFVFPAQRGTMIRGIPTGVAAAPLKSQFADNGAPPPVWPYIDGTVQGIALIPLHKKVPQAALADPQLYELLALVDAIRGERVRERSLGKEELTKRLVNHA